MSITYHIDAVGGCTYVRWNGTVNASEFLAHVERLCAEPGWPPPERRHLTDLRFSTLDPSMNMAALERAAELYSAHMNRVGKLRVAIIANEAFPLASDFERLVARYGATAIVFNFLDIACTWLDLDGQAAERELRRLAPENGAGPVTPT